MRKTLSYTLIAVFMIGCASTPQAPAPKIMAKKEEPAKKPMPELQNIDEKQLDAYEMQSGVIIAKTDFKGVMEKTYVKLFFEDVENEVNKFNLYIGDKSGQQAFPWDVKTVKPGYFFIELPAGQYKITSISIPVGSTQATEKIDLSLEVIPEKVSYVGTLSVVGTKEKIKLGGLPVIKPGFEYTATVLDEKEEAFDAFRVRYPNYSKKIEVQLMQLNDVSVNDENINQE